MFVFTYFYLSFLERSLFFSHLLLLSSALVLLLHSFLFLPMARVHARVLLLSTVSLTALVVIAMLFTAEFTAYLRIDTVDHLVIDDGGNDKLRISFDVIFPHLPCDRKPPVL